MYIFILALLGCLGCSLFVITCLRFVDFVYFGINCRSFVFETADFRCYLKPASYPALHGTAADKTAVVDVIVLQCCIGQNKIDYFSEFMVAVNKVRYFFAGKYL